MLWDSNFCTIVYTYMRKKNTLSRYPISPSWQDKQVGKYYMILILLVNLFYNDFGMENAWKVITLSGSICRCFKRSVFRQITDLFR